MSKKRGDGQKSRQSRARRGPTDQVPALRERVAELERELAAERVRSSEAVDQQSATAGILGVIARSPGDLLPVAQAIADSAFRLCECRFAAAFHFDGELIHWLAGRGTTETVEAALRAVWPRPPAGQTLTSRPILARETIHIHDAASDPDWVAGLSAANRAAVAIRSFLGVPILRDGQAIGAIGLSRSEVRPFSAREIALIETFADQAAIAMENARLFHEREARNHDLSESLGQQTAASEILRVISGSPTEVQPVFEAIAESATRLCDA